MKITLYLHSSKESAYEAARAAGLRGEVLKAAMYLGYEHKMEYEVDPETGIGTLVAVDDRKIET